MFALTAGRCARCWSQHLTQRLRWLRPSDVKVANDGGCITVFGNDCKRHLVPLSLRLFVQHGAPHTHLAFLVPKSIGSYDGEWNRARRRKEVLDRGDVA